MTFFLKWNDLVLGYDPKSPVSEPFQGTLAEPGIYGILGQNGCGKSTLIKTWLGLLPPLAGALSFGPQLLGAGRRLYQGVSYVPQVHKVNQYFHISVSDFARQGFGSCYKKNPTDEKNLFDFLSDWQLGPFVHQSFHELSGGQKARCLIVRALVSNPKLIFLDEPLASLDVCCQKQLMETLVQLVVQKKVCVCLIDHHLDPFQGYLRSKIVFERGHDASRSRVCLQNF